MLEVEDLHFSYSPRLAPVLEGVSHSFTPGAVTALTGVSGRGKSTLLYVLGLMLRPTSGRVLLGGEDVSRLPDQRRSWLRARHLGFVFQDAALDPARPIIESVMEPGMYAGIALDKRRLRAHALLETMGLAQRASHRPGEVSGGQAQRVAVARALVNDPSVILADEPTGNLDRSTAEGVLSALRAARRDRTVVIATHDPFVVEIADEVLEL